MNYLDQTPTVNQRCSCFSVLFLFLSLLGVNTLANAQSYNAPYKISGDLTGGEDVSFNSFQISPDGATVVYRVEDNTNGVAEIYSVPITGGSAPVKLNGPLLPSGGFIFSGFQISPDGSTVVFQAFQDTIVNEIFSVPIAGGTAPVKLNGPLPIGGIVQSGFQISPNGATVVYRANQETTSIIEIYSVPIAGGTAPVKLNGPLPSSGDVLSDFQISPDGATVVYRADQDTDSVFEIYSVPIAGGTAPVKLNGTLPSGGEVFFGFQISPDGTTVVYQADQDTGSVFEIYSVPIAGGTAPVKLNGTLISGGAILSDFQISPDGTTVVYNADQDTNGVNEIYSVPITGGTPAVKLNGPLPSSGDVLSDFQISPDGATVVYRAYQDANGVTEIYSVPIAGGTAPVKLNGPLVSGGNVSSTFQISPDGLSVVYRADQDTTSIVEIYSVPITGGTAPVKLNGPLPSAGDVYADFQISPDDASVVYTADQDTTSIVEIYSVPIAGGTAPVKLNGPLTSGGGVSVTFRFSPDGATVVYRADQDTVNVNELFAVSRSEDWFCLPIKASNDNIAVICL